jgi:hypothetical protein
MMHVFLFSVQIGDREKILRLVKAWNETVSKLWRKCDLSFCTSHLVEIMCFKWYVLLSLALSIWVHCGSGCDETMWFFISHFVWAWQHNMGCWIWVW